MATITLEIGKKGKKKERSVSFLICQGKTKKRIPTEVTVTDADLTSNQKKIKNIEKARIIEELRRTYQDRLYALSLEIVDSSVCGVCLHLFNAGVHSDYLPERTPGGSRPISFHGGSGNS